MTSGSRTVPADECGPVAVGQGGAGGPGAVEASQSLRVFNAGLPLFEALNNRHRQAILALLVAEGPLTVSEVAADSSLTRTAVSHHLKILAGSGLVGVEQVGTRRYCRANTDFAFDYLSRLGDALRTDVTAAEQCRRPEPSNDGTP